MDYQRIYTNIVERAKDRLLETYTEKHHIIPKCMGGSDNPENLVSLTPEEHYVAHQLLTKMYPDNGALAKAAMMMTANRPSNKVYGWLRKRHAKAMSESQAGDGNSQYGTRWVHNNKLKKSKKISKLDALPNGWNEGRKVKFEPTVKEIERLQNQAKKQEWLDYLKTVMYYYRDHDISMRELSKKFNVGHNVYVSFGRYFKDEYQEIIKNKPSNSKVTKEKYTGV